MFNDERLNAILRHELEAGNAIREDTSWPPRCTRLIVLEARFAKRHEHGGALVYSLLDDPRNWHSDYATPDGSECLACR